MRRAALAAAMIATLASTAVADEETVRLELVATGEASGCTDAAALRRAVEQRLGRTVFVQGPASTELRVSLSGEPSRWVATVAVKGSHTQRAGVRSIELAPGGCAEAREALAVVVAVTLGDGRPAPPPPAPPPSVPEARVGAGAFVTSSTQPGPAFGALARAGWRGTRLPALELTVAATVVDSRVVSADGAGASFATLSAELAACPALAQGARATLHACVALGADRVRARGRGLDVERDVTRFVPRAAAGLGVALPLGAGFWARVDARLEAPLERRTWVYDLPDGSTRPLWSAPAVGAGAALTLERSIRR